MFVILRYRTKYILEQNITEQNIRDFIVLNKTHRTKSDEIFHYKMFLVYIYADLINPIKYSRRLNSILRCFLNLAYAFIYLNYTLMSALEPKIPFPLAPHISCFFLLSLILKKRFSLNIFTF